MKVTIIGTGYVGLVTGTCFAETGNTVNCVDIDETKVLKMQRGNVPIYEPGLEELFSRNIKEGRLQFTTDLATGLDDSQFIFLCLPTPPNGDGEADTNAVHNVASQLGPLLKSYTVIVNKSTVPVGTSKQVHALIAKSSKVDFDVVSNPEFLREGKAVEDFMKPDRIVIGTDSERASKLMAELYRPFILSGNPILFMDAPSAEITKYAANAFLSTKISFMNEMANLCEKLGANVDNVRQGIGADERIGKRFLFPGPGFGGSCFPKDVLALQQSAKKLGVDLKILSAVLSVNDSQKQVLFEKVNRYFDNRLNGKTVAVWGLAFKPDTDDVRESPALTLIKSLLTSGAIVQASDPEAIEVAKKSLGNDKALKYFTDKYEALDGADALIIVTDWSEYRTPDFELMKQKLHAPVIFDGRNLYEPAALSAQGFYYDSLGRITTKPTNS